MRKKLGIYLIFTPLEILFSKRILLFLMGFSLVVFVLGSGVSYIMAQEDTTPTFKKFKKGEKFTIALIPEKNVFDQRKRYEYIADYLSRKLNLNVRTKILSNYGEICDAFLEGKADAGFFGSFSYVLTHTKAAVVPIARPVWPDGSSTYSGYMFVRKDSGIKTVEDMKGKRIALVHKATTAGYIFQLAYFKKHGIESIEKYFSKIYFTGSHDASAWAVYMGEADVGGGKNHIFNALSREYPDFKEQMTILSESFQVPSNGLVVRKDLDPALKKQLRDLLLNLNKTEEGKRVLEGFGAKRFIKTKDEDYAPLYRIVEKLGIDLKNYPYKE